MKTVFSLILILFVTSSCFAQERGISKDEFNQAFFNGMKSYFGKSYRTIRTVEMITKGKPELSGKGKTVTEFASGMMYSKADFMPNLKIKSRETIRIGNVTYIRNGHEEWQKQPRYTIEDDDKWNEKLGKDPLSVKNSFTLLEEQKVYKAFESEILNNQKVSVLGYVRNTKLRYPKTNMETTIAGSFKCWIASDGRLLKTESDTVETRQDGKIISMLQTVIYEFDLNIKIKAPL